MWASFVEAVAAEGIETGVALAFTMLRMNLQFPEVLWNVKFGCTIQGACHPSGLEPSQIPGVPSSGYRYSSILVLVCQFTPSVFQMFYACAVFGQS